MILPVIVCPEKQLMLQRLLWHCRRLLTSVFQLAGLSWLSGSGMA